MITNCKKVPITLQVLKPHVGVVSLFNMQGMFVPKEHYHPAYQGYQYPKTIILEFLIKRISFKSRCKVPFEPIFDEMDAILFTLCKFLPFSQKYLIDVIKYKHIQVNKLYSGKSYFHP